jgi:hypothetical protein
MREPVIVKASSLVCAAILLLPAAALAASAFDGTWKINMNHVQLSKKPDVYVLEGGNYTCSSCGPAYTVKADGTDQKVTGHGFDTLAVTATPTSLTLVTKLKGKTLSTVKKVVGADGNSAETEATFTNGAAPIIVKSTSKRVGTAAPGTSPFSGSWLDTKIDSVSDAGQSETVTMTDDGFTMKANGQNYDAKFDDKKYPVTGDATNTMVVLKKISDTEVMESDYTHGKLVETLRMKVSADGKTMHVIDTALQTGQVTRYTLDKQP